MNENILRDSLVTKIFLSYTEGEKKHVMRLKLKFMDNRQAYFSAPTPENYEKPKMKTPAEIKIYTVDGVYRTDVMINDSSATYTEIFFEVSLPKVYEFIQHRSSSRNRTELPVNIKYNDGFEINATTFDLAIGGLAFYSKDQYSSIYKKLPAILTLSLPTTIWTKGEDPKIMVESVFVRERREESDEEHFGEYLYSYKFINLPKETENELKKFLINND